MLMFLVSFCCAWQICSSFKSIVNSKAHQPYLVFSQTLEGDRVHHLSYFMSILTNDKFLDSCNDCQGTRHVEIQENFEIKIPRSDIYILKTKWPASIRVRVATLLTYSLVLLLNFDLQQRVMKGKNNFDLGCIKTKQGTLCIIVGVLTFTRLQPVLVKLTGSQKICTSCHH